MLDSDLMPGADPVVLAQSAAAWLSRSAPPEKRLAACRRMLEAVQRHIVVELIQADEQSEPFRDDPYGIELASAARSWR